MDQRSSSFTRDDTAVAKGIAIICMLFHHTISNVCYKPFFELEDHSFIILLAASCKVCVSLLTILSGYGLAEVYKKRKTTTLIGDFKFVLTRLVQLLSILYPINLALSWLNLLEIYVSEETLIGGGQIFLHLIGIKRYAGDWYLFAIVIFYILFPILYRFVNMFRIKSLIVSFLPWICFFIHYFINFKIKWDNSLFYMFAFCAGIYLSVENKLQKPVVVENSKKLKAIIIFVVAVLLRQIITLPMDTFVALSIINLQVMLGINSRVLNRFGKESANIWLIHVFIIRYFQQFFKDSLASELLLFVITFALSLVASIVLNVIKEKTRFNFVVKQIRTLIEGER